MSKRRLPWFLFVVLLSVPRCTRAETAKSDRPNILFVLMDNIGQDWFGCYGSTEGQTPFIDRLAAEGVRFPNCYVSPLCSTSRVVFLTGRYPCTTGWTVHHDSAIYGGGSFDAEREVSFARVLKEAGYATAVAGKWQINNLFEQPDALAAHGFEEHCLFPEGPRGHPAHIKRYWDPYIIQNGERIDAEGRFGPDIYTNSLIDFIKRDREQPFLAFYSMVFCHMPVTKTPFNRDDSLNDRQQLAGMMRYADHCIERLVTALDESGQRDSTVIIITTDNGTPAYMGGRVEGRVFQAAADTMVEGPMKEGSINVPLIVSGPPHLVSGGRTTAALADSSDVFPTLVELAGAGLPKDRRIDGQSFVDVLNDESAAAGHRAWMHSQYAERHVVRDNRYKLHSSGEFFDLQQDPLEIRDLAASTNADYVAARRRLRGVIDAFPPNADQGFIPRSISARRMGIGVEGDRANDAKLAPKDFKPKQ
jgi:arylsulfatase A-like enzyme